ncbi:MAG: gamma-glutamyl-gamma-aminobutyrate hydrolase family protein [Clostridiaceae bacterium]
MGKRPIIGITPGFMRDKNKSCLGQGYIEGINRAGGLAVILTMTEDRDMIEQVLDTADGILFSGGPDMDARYFGEENLKCGGEISPQRDGFETLLAKRAIEREKPLLGICRGMQLLNVAMGGTLHQDIHIGHKPEDMLKHWQEAPEWYPIHDIQISPDSKLCSIYGSVTLGVNSFHHQAVKLEGNSLSVSAASSDGIIEAIEGHGPHFIIAVQWHPELMWQENPLHLRLFEAFVAAAGRRV